MPLSNLYHTLSLNQRIKIFTRMLFALLCILMFSTACGSTTTATKSTGPQISFTSQSLICPDRGEFEPSNYLVLKTDRLNYDAGELQEMQTYVQQTMSTQSTPPGTIAWVTGATVGNSSEACILTTVLTNTGDSEMTLNNIRVQRTQAPVVNKTQYRLVDLCPLSKQITMKCGRCREGGCGTGTGGGNIVCNLDITLNPNNTIFADPKTNCGADISFNPQDALEIDITFHPMQNLTYSVTPAFSIQTSTGSSVYTVKPTTQVSFIRPDQFSCYSLQNNVFVSIPLNAKNSDCI